jgi:hypothetical protein
VTEYLLAALVVFAVNLLPAFGPPTWLVLVYLTLTYDLSPAPVIVLAVIAASSGRFLMASGVRKYRLRLPKDYVINMTNLGSKITNHNLGVGGLFVLFIWSPLSSAQMFVTAGLIPQVRIGLLTLAFAIGRSFTYSTYVYAADSFSQTDLGKQFVAEMFSPLMIAIQVILILGIVLLGKIKWKTKITNSNSHVEN